MKIKTAANNFYETINGKIEFEAVERQLKTLGYEVLFFNTSVGDAELARYAQTEKAKTSKAFTYVGTAKIIFIDNLLSVEDKLYVLLHETGHIVLKHLEFERLSTHNKILLDIDADTFVHFLLNHKRDFVRPALIAALIVTLTVFTLLCTSASRILFTSNNYSIPAITDYVYISGAGSHYHRETCGTIYGSSAAKLEREEAQKLFTPCKMCNP